MKTNLCAYLGAVFLALVATPIAIRVGMALNIVDRPGLRKVHGAPVPRIGGVAIALAMLVVAGGAVALDDRIGAAFGRVLPKGLTLLATALFMLIIGLLDDIYGLRARVKLLAQLAAAVTLCAAGIRIDSVGVGEWFRLDFGWLAWPITIFWIVGLTNAVNLIDGLDGLAAGICMVACGAIAAFALYFRQPLMAVLMLGAMGSLTGFLFFNFNPARIFMGDGGTYFLGFILAGSSVMSAAKSATLVGLALPALALGVPIFDTLCSVLRRILQRRSLFAPDRSHVHHRLLDMGLRQRHVVAIMYGVTLLVTGLGMFMMITRDTGTLLIFGCLWVLLLLLFRGFGSIRLRDTLTALRKNRTIAHQIGEEKRNFEEAQLRLSEVNSFQAWWSATCAAAEKMGFQHLRVTTRNRDASTRVLSCQLRSSPPEGPMMLRTVIPARDRRSGPPVRVEIEVPADDSLEAAGRRVALFARLIDENPLANLPTAAPGARRDERGASVGAA